MNLLHNRICASDKWAEKVRTGLFPAVLDDLDLGGEVLEIGPGLGVTTRLLAERVPKLTALEVDEKYVALLRRRLDTEIVHGDAADMPFPDASFTGVVCFTMLHHVPSPALQDRVFAEACRVLRPGGVFAGSDGQPSLRFRLIHLRDTLVPVDPSTLPARLTAAGFEDVRVWRMPGRVNFTARRPG
ncbi:class I SAM-dependent methyltransferase [Actinoallomurus sp. NPDC050550]|uniref:class I SAM-dependent methyltransferase n=1 Tax=Actinoallomurus sp. NPDC050550 TaxID=3154937 RepID=UPI0033D2CD82